MNRSRKQLAPWVRNQFHLPNDVDVDTISRTIKKESKIIEYSKSEVVHNGKVRFVRSQALENAILIWVCDMLEKKINISDSQLQAKANRIFPYLEIVEVI